MSRRVRLALPALFLLAIPSFLAAQPPARDAAVPPGWRAMDTNGDGLLSKDEAPAPLADRFDRVDGNSDGKISPAEWMAARRTQPRPGGPPPAGLENVTVLRDLAYVEGGHERQKLDLYLPKEISAENPPGLIVWIHGGAWQGGSKEGCPARYLTRHGFAVASVNYRLSQHAVFPAQIEDCKTAIRYLREHATKHGYDGERIGVWGSSAGGHLVSLLGTSGDVEELEGPDLYADRSSRVQAVCNYYGPTELLKMGEQAGSRSRIDHDAPNSPESKLVGGPIQERQDVAKLASPMTHISADDPPFLTVHGDQDEVVPVKQGVTFHEALKAAGVDSELIVVPGGGHGGFRDLTLDDQIAKFFERTLGK